VTFTVDGTYTCQALRGGHECVFTTRACQSTGDQTCIAVSLAPGAHAVVVNTDNGTFNGNVALNYSPSDGFYFGACNFDDIGGLSLQCS
jgi:hypothetical protein